MSNELALPSNVKDILKEKVLVAFMGLIPEEKLNEYIDNEVKAFFETEQMLTIEQTTVTVDNPSYKPNSRYDYDKKELSLPAIQFGSKMTPFRQMVWSILFAAVKPRIEDIILDSNSTLHKELDKWIIDKVQPEVNGTCKTLFDSTAMHMSSIFLHKTLRDALTTAHMNVHNALINTGINTSAMQEGMLTDGQMFMAHEFKDKP